MADITEHVTEWPIVGSAVHFETLRQSGYKFRCLISAILYSDERLSINPQYEDAEFRFLGATWNFPTSK